MEAIMPKMKQLYVMDRDDGQIETLDLETILYKLFRGITLTKTELKLVEKIVEKIDYGTTEYK